MDTSATNDKSLYTGFETNFSLRIPGTTLFGSWTAEHNISVFCENNDDPNGVSTNDLYSGATVSAGGRFCDQRKFHIPLPARVQARRQLSAAEATWTSDSSSPAIPERSV